jgi:Ca2+-binding EF-hand superfamily protein
MIMPDTKARRALFNRIDVNGNGGLSLAEIDKAVVEGLVGRALGAPGFNDKPALMRAYKAADANGDSFIDRAEFAKLLWFIHYFNNSWGAFSQIDSDHDRRLNVEEFAAGCATLGLKLSPAEAKKEFDACDSNGGGMVLFDEFCAWIAKRQYSTTQTQDPRRSPPRKLRGASPSGRKDRTGKAKGMRKRGLPVAESQAPAVETMSPQSPSPAVLLSALGAKLGYEDVELQTLIEEQHGGDMAAALGALRGLMAARARQEAANGKPTTETGARGVTERGSDLKDEQAGTD